jgi:predicted lipoprotein with Yx(FWY)xxD motif
MLRRYLVTLSLTALTFTYGLLPSRALAQGLSSVMELGQSDELGHYLVTSDGFALYAFLNDVDGNSVCYDTCAVNWPPLLITGAYEVGEGLDPTLIGAHVRRDGSVQLTYNGWPLYTFIRDTEPGTTAGQGVNDVWFVVSPEGAAIGAPAAAELGFDELMEIGGRVFQDHCAMCHGVEGNQALVSHAAILDGFSRLNDKNRVLRAVINGRGYMPAIGQNFSNEDLAAVATYARNSWSNSYGAVSVADVEALR